MKDAKKRRYCKNTVKGQRRGSKWPEETRTAALCDLLTNNNICAVAKRYGVPESTLRTWLAAAEKSGEAGKDSLFVKARKDALRTLNHNASQSAVMGLDYIRRRLEANDRNIEVYNRTREALDEMPVAGEEEYLALEKKLERYKPMSDQAAAGYIRTLQAVSERTGRLMDEQGAGENSGILVQFGGLGEDITQ